MYKDVTIPVFALKRTHGVDENHYKKQRVMVRTKAELVGPSSAGNHAKADFNGTSLSITNKRIQSELVS